MKHNKFVPLAFLTALIGFHPVGTNAALVADYTFSHDLTSSVAGAPDLQYLGVDPVFVAELFDSGNRPVLRFRVGEGLSLSGFSELAGDSYTISVLFRFDETSSWRRIIDFKNRTSDWGLYGYYGQLNFYNIQTGPEELVKAAEYSEVTLTRDENQVVKGYVDGSLQIEFSDSGGNALTNASDVLMFFRDDLVYPNEHTSGRISRLQIYDRALTADEVREGVPELNVRFGGGSAELGGGWRESAWFGRYNELYYPWLSNSRLGWTRVWLRQDGSFWIYQVGGRFIWSDTGVYPYGWDVEAETWVVASGSGAETWTPLETSEAAR